MDGIMDQFDDLELQSTAEDVQADHGSSMQEDTKSQTMNVCQQGQKCHLEEEEHDASHACKSPVKSASEPGELTCAVCLSEIPLEDMAMIKGCDHIYCVFCILRWSLHKENPWCPQCKHSFTTLLTYRDLQGCLNDFPQEESVVLLKRAHWFESTIRKSPHDSAQFDESILADDTAWQDYADDYELEEDEAIEEFYFSSAAGRARVILGNRRFGEGGYISGGRRQARPTRRGSSNGKGKSKQTKRPDVSTLTGAFPVADQRNPQGTDLSGSSSGLQRTKSSTLPPKTPAIPTPNANGGRCSMLRRSSSPATASPSPHQSADLDWGGRNCGISPSSSGSLLLGSSPSGSGRRARRNARRAAEDAVISAKVSQMPDCTRSDAKSTDPSNFIEADTSCKTAVPVQSS